MNNFRALLIASVALAIMAFASPWVVSLKASVWFALLWGVVVLIALFSFRKRAFWCLVGAPLAVYWPVIRLILCKDFTAFC